MNARVAIVTGASSGIGRQVALAFARRGDQVVATTRTGRLDAELAAIPGVVGVAFELADPVGADAVVAAAMQHYGRIDVVVANAGRGFRGTIEQLTVDDFDLSLQINFLGQVRLVKAALPGLAAAESGRVIAVSSVGGVIGQPFQDAYCAAKFALEGWLESWHPVAASRGIAVTVIEPGAVSGAFGDKAHLAGALRQEASDEHLTTLFRRYAAVRSRAVAQQGADVARIVLDCAEDPEPPFRLQTSAGVRSLVERKLSDPSGGRITRMTGRWLAPAADVAPSAPADVRAR